MTLITELNEGDIFKWRHWIYRVVSPSIDDNGNALVREIGSFSPTHIHLFRIQSPVIYFNSSEPVELGNLTWQAPPEEKGEE